MTTTDTTGSTFDQSVQAHLARITEHNATALDQAAEAVLDTVRADGLILTAGAGHSLAAVAETFYRAGGLACVRPLYHPDLLPMHGAQRSTTAERRSGLAADVLDVATLGGHDALVVFSTSGVNPYPVELAALVRDAGRPVIAVTSGPSSSVAPRRAGSTLAENATIVLDTLVVPGDSTYPLDAPVTAPISTVVNAFLWNLLLVRLLDLARRSSLSLPLWRSSNVPGGDEANAGLLAKFTPRVPALG
ncbi:MAG TPA: sugar isomerase domain-containing protein [Pseudonocardiaceae bacterium]|jgi:uncharacterized phosphosugar-binding protein|nr:sugar isomerase domain-containing protein [Pseudonocardiaceae bacterium]